jgi:hypothetical protein
VRLRICFEDDIARVLAEQAGVEFVDIGVTQVDRRAAELLPRPDAESLRAIPLRLHSDGAVSVAVADPTDDTIVPKLKLALDGYPMRLLVTTPTALRAAWDAASRTTRSTFARFPSTTGRSPPSSRRASSTRPDERTVWKPKSDRKSRGKTVRWTRNRS